MKKSKRMKRTAGALLAFLLAWILYGLYNPLSVSKITVLSEAIEHPVRIALVSDLHSCKYGEKQAKLVDAIDQQNPDLICLTGDLFDDKLSDDQTEIFLAEISKKYPCYYVTGNHECRSGTQAFQEKMEILQKYGISRLSNESVELEVREQRLAICGVDDPDFALYDNTYDISNALFQIQKGVQDSSFTLLLSHRPEYFPLYADYGYDLILCGHAHGGQWRIPGLLENGLLAPNQGLFPNYTNGSYTAGESTMIVSRGLAKESTLVPRLYNRPELVLIEVQ